MTAMLANKIDDPGLKAVLKVAKKGEALAAMLEITPQAISQWKRVPHTRVLRVEEKTGVPRHVQRPDLYPPPVSAPNIPSADSTTDRGAGPCPHPKRDSELSPPAGSNRELDIREPARGVSSSSEHSSQEQEQTSCND